MSPKKKTTILTYLWSKSLLAPKERHVCPTVKDSFARVDENTKETQHPFDFVFSEYSNVGVPLCYHAYMTPFSDHKDDEGIILNPRSILRMRPESDEVPWTKLRFELKVTKQSSIG